MVATRAEERLDPIAVSVADAWRLHGDGSLAFDVVAGGAILRGIYGGNLHAWRARQRKDFSFKRLSSLLAGDRISATRLYRAVATFVLLEQRPSDSTVSMSKLPASAYHAVLGLPTADAWSLLSVAAETRMTARQLAAAARSRRSVRRGGRIARSPGLGALLRMLRIHETELAHVEARGFAHDLAQVDVGVLRVRLGKILADLERLTAALAEVPTSRGTTDATS